MWCQHYNGKHNNDSHVSWLHIWRKQKKYLSIAWKSATFWISMLSISFIIYLGGFSFFFRFGWVFPQTEHALFLKHSSSYSLPSDVCFPIEERDGSKFAWYGKLFKSQKLNVMRKKRKFTCFRECYDLPRNENRFIASINANTHSKEKNRKKK